MKIKVSNNKELVAEIRQKLKDNDNYCPCRLTKNEDTRCPCKEFREQSEPGECHCGLYYKELKYDIRSIDSESNVPTETYKTEREKI